MSTRSRRAGRKTIHLGERVLEEHKEVERRRREWEAHCVAEQLRRAHPDWRVKG